EAVLQNDANDVLGVSELRGIANDALVVCLEHRDVAVEHIARIIRGGGHAWRSFLVAPGARELGRGASHPCRGEDVHSGAKGAIATSGAKSPASVGPAPQWSTAHASASTGRDAQAVPPGHGAHNFRARPLAAGMSGVYAARAARRGIRSKTPPA